MNEEFKRSLSDADPALVLTTASLLPDRSPISGAQVRSLIDAAADAGFAGMSLVNLHHNWAVADDMTAEAFFAYHRDRGLAMPTIGAIFDWATPDRRAVSEACTPFLDIAVAAGASYVVAVRVEPDLPPLAEASAGLATLCDLAADRGLGISFEFVPGRGVPDLPSALRLFEATDRDNLGLCFDTWQWFRGTDPDIAVLRDVPPERIYMVQLSDAPGRPAGDLVAEGLSGRLLPGDGVIDILGVLEALDDIGVKAIVTSEVFNKDLMALGVAENARRQHDAALAMLAQHRARRPAAG
jgi:sugar phosphate isomerase/epimerase